MPGFLNKINYTHLQLFRKLIHVLFKLWIKLKILIIQGGAEKYPNYFQYDLVQRGKVLEEWG